MAVTMAPTRSSRAAFVLLGGVQVTLIFTLAAVAVPLPGIGVEFGVWREELILLSAAYGLTFAGLLLFGDGSPTGTAGNGRSPRGCWCSGSHRSPPRSLPGTARFSRPGSLRVWARP